MWVLSVFQHGEQPFSPKCCRTPQDLGEQPQRAAGTLPAGTTPAPVGLQSCVPAKDEGEEESQTSRDGKYFSPDPLEAPFDGSREGAAWAAKLAGDSNVPRPCREPQLVAADSSLESKRFSA